MGRRFFQQLLDTRIKPLTLTAQEAGAEVMLKKGSGTPTLTNMKYRTNSSVNWNTYTLGQVITLANKGDYVQFWNESSTFSTATTRYIIFSLEGSIAASGNVQSLLNYAETVPAYALFSLFFTCSTLTTPPELPAESIGIFSYSRMFYGCTSLVAAPRLPIKTLPRRGVYQMFYRCTNLQSLRVQLEEWNTEATENWVYQVAENGTFYKPAALAEEYGADYIPSGWNVVNID